ncbi:MAG: DNA cytosine methyltransferase [Patescibacteria group bacterium]
MKVISLFTGAGGMDLGFLKAGHKIVWANDNDPDSCLTYEKNFKHKPVCKNIEEVPSSSIPEADVVIGGFPCQGFSIANPYRNTEDKRNTLYLELLRVIRDKKPKYFVAENVAGLCSIGGYENAQDRKNHTGKVLKVILEELRHAIPKGYHVEFQILNAADYGVPQTRRRVIILGTRKDVKKIFVHPKPVFSKEGEIFPKWKTVRESISDLPEKPSKDIPNHTGTSHQVKINGHIGNRATDWDKPSPTIVGRGGGTGGPVIIPHPNLKRRMTVRETARLQSFPDDFIFEGSVSSQYRQIGNAVPWPLAYYIAKQIPKNPK